MYIIKIFSGKRYSVLSRVEKGGISFFPKIVRLFGFRSGESTLPGGTGPDGSRREGSAWPSSPFRRRGRGPGNERKRPFMAEGKTFSGARTGVGDSPAGPIAVIVQKVEVLIGFSPDRRNARFLFLLPHHGPARQKKAVSRRRRNGLLAIAG
jgi:hypothetical protein